MRSSPSMWRSSLFVAVLAALLLLGAAQDDAKPQSQVVADVKDAKPAAAEGYAPYGRDPYYRSHEEEEHHGGRYGEDEYHGPEEHYHNEEHYYHDQEQHYGDDTPHHKYDDGSYHEKKTCMCSCPIATADITKLTDKNGCKAQDGDCTAGEFCTTTLCDVNVNGAPCNGGKAFEFCGGTSFNSGGGGELCYQVTCPGTGTLRVQALAGRTDCCTPASTLGSLRLFKGSYTLGNVSNVVAQTPINVKDQQIPFDTTVPCTAGQKYELCEIDQIFIKDFTKFTYTTLSHGKCATGCTTVKCTSSPSYPKKPYYGAAASSAPVAKQP